ncbi:MAG: MFS transporter, partial [Chloroflexota bacterium]
AFEAFQRPAYTAATTVLIPKEQYVRASGMRSIADSASEIIGPFAAGAVLALVGLGGIMVIDLVTLIFALITLISVRIPAPTSDDETEEEPSTTWQEMRFGFRYIFQRRGLLGLLIIYSGINFFAGLTYFAVLPTLILARTGGDEFALATVQAALGIGGLIGGLILSIWGGPKRQIHGVLAAGMISFLGGDLLFAVGQSLPVWILGALVASVFIPFIIGSNRAIWQAKVAPQLQGRVFSVQDMLRTATVPIAYLVAGPLADYVFEPAFAENGRLVPSLGWFVGTGPGAGMGLMFACTAVLGMVVSGSGYLFSAVRNVEDELPDHPD